MPFGDEIYLSPRKNRFIERSRFWNTILKGKRNIGAMLQVEPVAHWITQAAYFTSYSNSTSILVQDILARTTLEMNALSTGLSFYYDDKSFNGAIFEIEKRSTGF